ncbi:hypothetical protein KIK06_20100 [Nocardiopsis sp. EMB25]|uniref:hypothetical protein n=1 Tax=Nocardiopsis TaxID=2013 RepID=UPI00034DA03D|nr:MULTISPECIES: hypothetical protein [Nocardiopsis]MCY9786200.1 hypothetical protein [Nocardiopsis sp. EMB25]
MTGTTERVAPARRVARFRSWYGRPPVEPTPVPGSLPPADRPPPTTARTVAS